MTDLYEIPTHLENIFFLITQSGLYDEHIMPEIQKKFRHKQKALLTK